VKTLKFALASLLMLVAADASADLIASLGGDLVQVSPPGSVAIGATEDSDDIIIFAEKQNLTLGAAILANITAPGTATSVGTLSPGSILAGTIVSSYFVHFDPVGTPGGVVTLSGTVTFQVPILGIIMRNPEHYASDGLGAPSTFYPLSPVDRKTELNGEGFIDPITLSLDGKTLSFTLNSTTGIDQIRIITAVPEPGATLLLGGTLLGLAGYARRRLRQRDA